MGKSEKPIMLVQHQTTLEENYHNTHYLKVNIQVVHANLASFHLSIVLGEIGGSTMLPTFNYIGVLLQDR